MLGKFTYRGDDILGDIRERCGYSGDLAEIYAGQSGALAHKWHHYIPLYDRYFSPYRGTPVKFLEIGVSRGGSLDIWRRYFGPGATIFGIDIEQKCRRFDGRSGAVRIGSQDDPGFLAEVVEEMGGVDIVLDDGSHEMAHVKASLDALFPKLSVGGIYAIEDLHTAYWPQWGGGPANPDNFFARLRPIIDGMHRHYQREKTEYPDYAPWISGIHVHDSMVFFEKTQPLSPVHSKVG